MAEHVNGLLRAAPEPNALSFAVFVPAWRDTPAWESLSASPFLRATFVAPRGEHGYRVGDQAVARREH